MLLLIAISSTACDNRDDEGSDYGNSQVVIVYGTQSCSRTIDIIHELQQEQIDHSFKDVNIDKNSVEMWIKLHDVGYSGSSVALPVVDLNGNILITPTIEEIIDLL